MKNLSFRISSKQGVVNYYRYLHWASKIIVNFFTLKRISGIDVQSEIKHKNKYNINRTTTVFSRKDIIMSSLTQSPQPEYTYLSSITLPRLIQIEKLQTWTTCIRNAFNSLLFSTCLQKIAEFERTNYILNIFKASQNGRKSIFNIVVRFLTFQGYTRSSPVFIRGFQNVNLTIGLQRNCCRRVPVKNYLLSVTEHLFESSRSILYTLLVCSTKYYLSSLTP